jgi:hypothetical protein
MSERVTVRVMVQDVWDEVTLEVPANTAIATLKTAALARTGVSVPADDYVAKFRGALLDDEDRSVGDVGMVTGSSIILVPRRRRPVR